MIKNTDESKKITEALEYLAALTELVRAGEVRGLTVVLSTNNKPPRIDTVMIP